MELSKRLQTIAHMVTEGSRLVDIGTDHGYIPIYLLKNGKIPSALAMDVGRGPLERAKEHIQAYCLQEKAVCRLSNGFEQYEKGEADTAVIAGMGGALMEQILEEGKDKLPKELILQPQSEWFKVRTFLNTHRYRITEENMLIEDGKYYVVIRSAYEHKPLPELSKVEQWYGPCLLNDKNPVLEEYLTYKLRTLKQILTSLSNNQTESAVQRKSEIQKEITQIEGALKYYEA